MPKLPALAPLANDRAATPVQREIGQEWRGRSRDQVADQLRGEKAEGDAIAAVSIGGKNALCSGHRTDQGQSVAGGIECPGPTEFDVGISLWPKRGKLLLQRTRLLRDQAITRV